MVKDSIKIRGARTHNLKNISLEIPRNRFIVITGLSGSGKSSLAFDTIYAEGQRRYIESLSSYARQFLEQVDRPDVDSIEGLSPAIAIKQRSSGGTPRSTVGTVTEIYDLLRLLYARMGKPHCPVCGRQISSLTTQEIVDRIMGFPEETRLQILAPISTDDNKTRLNELLRKLQRDGFTRVKINGKIQLLEEIQTNVEKAYSISVVVDRLILKPGVKTRLTESIELALHKGKGKVILDNGTEEIRFNQSKECEDCGVTIPELTPQHFSFNNPKGACRVCKGLGIIRYFDPDLIITWPGLSVSEGAIPILKDLGDNFYKKVIEIMNHLKIDPYMPFYKLPEESKNIILFGYIKEDLSFDGIVPHIERLYSKLKNPVKKRELERYIGAIECRECNGSRLNPISRAVRVNGLTIDEICNLSVNEALDFFNNIKLTENEINISGRIIKEIKDRLGFLVSVGVGYLSLSRTTSTLSGGEEQRVRLATQMGSALSGVLYVLDEPTVGLHPRDTHRLIKNITELKSMGNTVIVVEHDRDMILASDHIIDLGPGAGPEGGDIVFQGTPQELINNNRSLTGNYLSGGISIPLKRKRKHSTRHWLIIEGASHNNLKDIVVKIPLGTLTCITGVSGSGKSTLMYDILYPELLKRVYGKKIKSGRVKSFKGAEYIDRVINIDQAPIGKSSRSNPATYTGIFNHIREIFSMLPDARVRGYTPSRFSFNVKGGRCEVCQGEGTRKIEMQFLPDVHVTCDVCRGSRFNRDTLEIKYKGFNIAQILDMSVKEVLPLFENIPVLRDKLITLMDVGLGYMKLGQPATTLSGGEAQRLKLSKELSKRQTGRTIYLLDEPTTGLHFEDIRRLLDLLMRLVELNNTVVVIEHHLDVIKNADFIIDLGPEGGERGGYVVGMGTPEEIMRNKRSYTGKFLKNVLH